MQPIQRNPVARSLAALVISGVLTGAVWLIGPLVIALCLFFALAAVVFALLTVAPDAIALQRRHSWRWWWRGSDDDGPFWPGTRIPRAPKRPR